jgi:hypothetical protein
VKSSLSVLQMMVLPCWNRVSVYSTQASNAIPNSFSFWCSIYQPFFYGFEPTPGPLPLAVTVCATVTGKRSSIRDMSRCSASFSISRRVASCRPA